MNYIEQFVFHTLIIIILEFTRLMFKIIKVYFFLVHTKNETSEEGVGVQ